MESSARQSSGMRHLYKFFTPTASARNRSNPDRGLPSLGRDAPLAGSGQMKRPEPALRHHCQQTRLAIASLADPNPWEDTVFRPK